MTEQRLQKILAEAGLCSRRKAEDLLRAGRVCVNGEPAALGAKADPQVDVITLDGNPIELEQPRYWLLNKPKGVVTTTEDPQGRETVLDLLPEGLPRLFPVGRLDMDTEGLLLLTNDGDLTHVMLHPSMENAREYRVTVRGRISDQAVEKLARGVELEDGPTAPGVVEKVSRDRERNLSTLHLTIGEGRKRQIRRTFDALGFPVQRLVRVRMGPLQLGRLASGVARPLREAEIQKLRRHAERLRSRAARRADAGARAKEGAGCEEG